MRCSLRRSLLVKEEEENAVRCFYVAVAEESVVVPVV